MDWRGRGREQNATRKQRMELEYYAMKAKLRDQLAQLESKADNQHKASESVRAEVTK